MFSLSFQNLQYFKLCGCFKVQHSCWEEPRSVPTISTTQEDYGSYWYKMTDMKVWWVVLNTCVFPPLTYSTVGLVAPVMRRPISMWPIQWFTPSNGLFHSWATVRATTATEASGAPMPGPKHTETKIRILFLDTGKNKSWGKQRLWEVEQK